MTPGASSSPFCSLRDLLVGDLAQNVDLARGHLLDLVDLLVHARILVGVANALEVTGARCARWRRGRGSSPLSSRLLVGALVVQVGEDFLVAENALRDA